MYINLMQFKQYVYPLMVGLLVSSDRNHIWVTRANGTYRKVVCHRLIGTPSVGEICSSIRLGFLTSTQTSDFQDRAFLWRGLGPRSATVYAAGQGGAFGPSGLCGETWAYRFTFHWDSVRGGRGESPKVSCVAFREGRVGMELSKYDRCPLHLTLLDAGNRERRKFLAS